MSIRMERANSQIFKHLTMIIQELNDPRLSEATITITNVETSPDFKYCKILISIVEGDEKGKKSIIKILQSGQGYLKRRLAEEIDMPHIPELKFILDLGYDYKQSIDKILEILNIPPVNESGEDDGKYK